MRRMAGLTHHVLCFAEGVKMHDGFVDAQERTADAVLEAVQAGLESTGAKKVLVTGHSLGAAIASLDGMMLRMKLDPSIAVTTTVFGLPRVGNKAWADLVDATVSTRWGRGPTLPAGVLAFCAFRTC